MQTIFSVPWRGESAKRRESPRATPDPFLVIRFLTGNHGIVLDVSPRGLGFLACEPIVENGMIEFEISGKSVQKTKAAGQIVWTDESRKRAGLKFTQLPEDLQTLIGRYFPLAADSITSAPNKVPSGQMPDLLTEEGILNRLVASDTSPWNFVANGVTFVLACLIALTIWFSIDQRASRASSSNLRETLSYIENRLPHPRGHGSSLLNRWVRKRSVTVAPSAPSAALTPVSPSNHSETAAAPQVEQVSATVTASPDPSTSISALLPTRSNDAAPSAEKLGSALPPHDSGEIELAQARQLLQKDSSEDNEAKATQLLWKAVEKGNAHAEVQLADMYLSGKGVAKSCNQAQVLLNSAQNRKNTEAQLRLADLSKYGCE